MARTPAASDLRHSDIMQSITVPGVVRRPLRALADYEYVIAPAAALALLLHPTPLTWPALVAGALPSVGRLIVAGRPWRRTPFDLGIALFSAGAVLGMFVSLAPADAAIRMTGVAAALILFGWARERASGPRTVHAATVAALVVVVVGAVLMVHLAAPFLRLERVPPLALLASMLEPLGLYRLLVADEAALQRFRLYASGTGAVAAVGLAMSVGFALAAPRRRWHAALGAAGLYFGGLLVAADNRGSMIAAALAVGALVMFWRPRLKLVAGLVVFGTLDVIALGVVQRGLSLTTVVERLDFWQKGLLLAGETPFTGVGLGVESVALVYRAAFQPAYPPFSHAHNIFVQGALEQGVLGLASLLLLTVAVLRLGVVRAGDGGSGPRGASLAAFGGIVALLAAGLTEIVALTTVGGALFFGLLGLLVAAHDDVPHLAPIPLVSRVQRVLPGRPSRTVAVAAVGLAVVGIIVLGRSLVAAPLLNAGTSALYRATLQERIARADRARYLDWSVWALQAAATVDPGGVAARRNLGLALAAAGDRTEAWQQADAAHALASPDDADALFGIGRAYAAAGAYDDAIRIWTDVGAGPQLMRLGRQLGQGSAWQQGIAAYVAAVTAGAPPAPAADAIVQAAQAHGESPEATLARLGPLATAGGLPAFYAHLRAARVYRLAGNFDRAHGELDTAGAFHSNDELALERGLTFLAAGHLADAEVLLRWTVDHRARQPAPVPDGDDPPYWLGVTLAKLGRPDEAAAAARTGLAELPEDQVSLRVPYQVLLGNSLLDAGQPVEALAAFRAGARLAPNDPQVREGIARASAAQR